MLYLRVQVKRKERLQLIFLCRMVKDEQLWTQGNHNLPSPLLPSSPLLTGDLTFLLFCVCRSRFSLQHKQQTILFTDTTEDSYLLSLSPSPPPSFFPHRRLLIALLSSYAFHLPTHTDRQTDKERETQRGIFGITSFGKHTVNWFSVDVSPPSMEPHREKERKKKELP